MNRVDDFLVIAPPVLVPTQLPVGAWLFASQLKGNGVHAILYDASIEFFNYTLFETLNSTNTSLSKSSLWRRAQRAVHYFRNNRIFDAHQHRTHINNLHRYLIRWSGQFKGWRLGLTDVTLDRIPPHDPEQFIRYVSDGGCTPFTAFLHTQLIPAIQGIAAKTIGVSVTYLSQIYFAIELGVALNRMDIKPVLGGALINVLDEKIGTPFDFNGLYTRIPPGGRLLVTGSVDSPLELPRLIHPLARYFTPAPIIPIPLSRGCYWNRCLFCPDANRAYSIFKSEALIQFLTAAMELVNSDDVIFNISDSAIPLGQLTKLLPFFKRHNARFYGFLRFETLLTQANQFARMQESGAVLLQFGLESGSQRLLDLYQKGIDLPQAEQILNLAHAHGIRNYVYLLFGLPTEEDSDREATLQFIRKNRRAIDYLNISIFNLPTDCALLAQPDRFDIIPADEIAYRKPLQLYVPFRGRSGSVRVEARKFIQGQFQRDSLVRPILLNTPDRLRIDHAVFFE
ncbi:radical SAM protein [candidate division KSB1 bacterium]|nr:radical SAM protein [candidate division KSB1 bacterium]